MGHFTVPCGISGIPIRYGDPIVGFNVEQARYQQYWDYIPANIPVVGTYDDYGRLEGGKEERSPENNPLVLCHKELWVKAAKGYDKKQKDYRNREYVFLKEFFDICKNNYLKNLKKYEHLDKSGEIFNGKGLGTSLAQNFYLLSLQQKTEQYAGTHGFFNHLVELSPSLALKNDWEKRIINDGPAFTDEEFDLLSQLSVVYKNVITRGRQITTTQHCYTEQDTDYKKEAAWHNAVAKFCTKTTKKRNRN